ncbi:MAG: hypothetical protein IT347_05495 [Candidatus Eisenbacteria bacterium]|nr:hypothetical protein [Candidatus Eisenbacteria bacterium]
MFRRWTAALLLAGTLTGLNGVAARAFAQAADPFPVVPRPAPERTTHRAAWACAFAGAGLIAASFPISELADRRYAAYLAETDPTAVGARFDATRRADQLASASLLAGEGLIVTAIWLRFVRRPHPARASVALLPGRCAVTLRF